MEKLFNKFTTKEAVSISFILTVFIWTLITVSPLNAFIPNNSQSNIVHIAITENGFEPKVTVVPAGTTVVWTNNLPIPVSLNSGQIHLAYLPILKSHSSLANSRSPETNEEDGDAYDVQYDWLLGQEIEPGGTFQFQFMTSGEYPLKAGITSASVIYVDAGTLEPEPATLTPEPTNTSQPADPPTVTPIATPSPTTTPTEEIKGALTISLVSDPADGLDFEFTLNDNWEFKLDHSSSDDNDGVSDVLHFNDLDSGQFTITLKNKPSYLLDAITCTSDQTNPTISINGSTAVIVLSEKEQVSCEYIVLKDSDGDRLADRYETNDLDLINAKHTGTDPNNPDTDADGINDGDEVLGTLGGLDLPNMGANPLRKTILIEYDWFDDNLVNKGHCANGEDGYHSHRPTASMIARIRNVYAHAPHVNPNGSTGIDLIQDYGQGGLFTGGNRIEINQNGLISGSVYGSEFSTRKAQNFASNRRGYFHYAIMAHQYGSTANFSSGEAEINGDDLIVSVYNYHCSDDIVGNTIVHELGHNLGLLHGGDDYINNKPNYNSVMNYRFQFTGIDSDESCDGQGDGIGGYSTGNRISLDENNLHEAHGVCGEGHAGSDWNNDGDMTDSGLVFNINDDSSITMLNDHDDWGSLYFLGILSESTGRSAQTSHIRPIEYIAEHMIPDFNHGAHVPTDVAPSHNSGSPY